MHEETFQDAVAGRFVKLVNLANIQSRIVGSTAPIRGRNDYAERLRTALDERRVFRDAALNYANVYLASFADTQSRNPMRLNKQLAKIAEKVSASLKIYGGSQPEGFETRLYMLNSALENGGLRPNQSPEKMGSLLSKRELGQINSTRFSRNLGHKLFEDEAGRQLRSDLDAFRQKLSDYMPDYGKVDSPFRNRQTGEEEPVPFYGGTLVQAKQGLLAEMRIPPSNPAHQIADARHFLPDHILGGPAVGRRTEREGPGRDPRDRALAQGPGQEISGEPSPATSLMRSMSDRGDEAGPSNFGTADQDTKRQRRDERDKSGSFSI